MVGRDRRRVPRPAAAWEVLAAEQAGMVSRSQVLALGGTPGRIGARLDSRRWRGVLPGVYATFDGPLPPLARAWAAVLHGGRHAVLGGRSALWLWGVLPDPPLVHTVCVPADVQVATVRGVEVVRRRGLDRLRHPAADPPRLRVEEAVLDVADSAANDAAAVEVVLRATQQRVTTPARLAAALSARARHRRRGLLREILDEVVDGVRSALERRWLRTVERPHGLPRPDRNPQETVLRRGVTSNRYRDLRFRRYGLTVELDGREAHRDWERFRDRRRDNAVTVAGDRSLRYGWVEVAGEPCEVALEVALLLHRLGWTGTPRACSPGCPVAQFRDRADLRGTVPSRSAR